MIDLATGAYTAQINPHGGGIVALSYDGADLVRRQDGAGGPPGFRGAVLVPWSNRIGDGTYRFAGVEHRLPINEPERNNALHGLVLNDEWEVDDATTDSTVLALGLGPETGYPFSLMLSLTYALTGAGLTATLRATNTGELHAPYGCGFHPYVLAGAGRVDDAALRFEAERRLETDPQRLLPRDQVGVPGTAYDFSQGQKVGTRELDDAFTGLRTDPAGNHVLQIADIRLWWSSALPWVHVFTPAERDALAVEPCTSPPDAFRTGVDLVVLAPGGSHRVAWGIGTAATASRHTPTRGQ